MKPPKPSIDLTVNQKDNPNICMRIVERTIDGKVISMPCYGKIFVQSIKQDDPKKVVAISKCGGCETIEEDEFEVPEVKHAESCLQSQARGSKPRVYLQSVMYPHCEDRIINDMPQQVITGYDVVWKCGGCVSDDGKERFP